MRQCSKCYDVQVTAGEGFYVSVVHTPFKALHTVCESFWFCSVFCLGDYFAVPGKGSPLLNADYSYFGQKP